jgi:hypothetical protein
MRPRLLSDDDIRAAFEQRAAAPYRSSLIARIARMVRETMQASGAPNAARRRPPSGRIRNLTSAMAALVVAVLVGVAPMGLHSGWPGAPENVKLVQALASSPTVLGHEPTADDLAEAAAETAAEEAAEMAAEEAAETAAEEAAETAAEEAAETAVFVMARHAADAADDVGDEADDRDVADDPAGDVSFDGDDEEDGELDSAD